MELSRRAIFRALFGAVAVPVAAKVLPDSVPRFDGGTFIQEPFVYPEASPLFDEISAITLRELNRNAIHDNFFAPTPFFSLLNRRQKIKDAGGDIVGAFCRMPGEKWDRLTGGLHWPDKAPSLPA